MTDTTPLFSPFTLNNGVEIRNRLVVTPMTHYASNPDGTLSDEEQAFLTGRADDFGIFTQQQLWYTQAVRPLSVSRVPMMRAIWQA